MPRRRSINIVCLAAAVLLCGFIVCLVVSQWKPEASYQGHSASYWLRAVIGLSRQEHQALDAFRQMGTNAEPVLVAAIEGRPDLYATIFRQVYPRLPEVIQRRFPQPQNLSELRVAAVVVLLNIRLSDIVPQLLPLLAKPDSELRMVVLLAVENQIGPRNAGQLSLLLLAANDPSPSVRAKSLLCLSHLGRSATSAAPIAVRLCADTNTDVRTYAALASWKITGQTNAAVPALEGILSQSQDGDRRHWAACYLLGMAKPDAMMITTFINSLTNRQSGVRMSACACLTQIGPPAAAAVPALRRALQDPEPEVRRRAEVALSRIDPEGSREK